MAKKESPKTESQSAQQKQKGFFSRIAAAFTAHSFALIKLILGICLLPFAYSASIAFLNQLKIIDKLLQNWFWAGGFSFLGIYLIVWEPAVIYTKGQRILEIIFGFFQPLVKTAPFVLPIYAILGFIAYGLASIWTGDPRLIKWMLFFAGFSAFLHLVFTAKSMRTKQDALKANYIFGYSFIYIINLGILAFAFSFIFKNYSFVDFSSQTFETGKSVFYTAFKQLFMVK